MSEPVHPVLQVLKQDSRYRLEAYQFISEALAYAHEVMGLGGPRHEAGDDPKGNPRPRERHLTGQQLCEAARQLALEQFGFMAKVVLNSWGVYSTGDFGEIVYNLIRVEQMKRSNDDSRADFDDVYDFDVAFQQSYEITLRD